MPGTTKPSPHQEPIRSDTHEARSERSYLAKAHDGSISKEARTHAAERFAELHEARTGERVDPRAEAAIGDAKAEERQKGRHHTIE
ncbi:hypothetical protein HK104_002655 [Borealophlyctis nickersoniae]|nr:hypothetical protein HK104_002655 [Borealophlyctis nickersoniae]